MWIGIDPGKTGACAALYQIGSIEIIRHAKATPKDIYQWLVHQKSLGVDGCVLERLWSRPTDGPVQAFRVGQNYGMLQGILAVVEIAHETISPQKWEKAMNVAGKYASQTDKKNYHKQVAQGLFPEEKIVHATADAILLAEYCRRHQYDR